MAQLATTLIVVIVYGLPAAVSALPVVIAGRPALVLAGVALAPLVYTVVFVLTAGLMSLPFQGAIVPGKFPRSWSHPVYWRRRIYGLCWTCLYYCKPVYFICLSIPALKWLTFRLFGYRGSMDFTIYPDTWIRDLPLLSFGEGAYISNRATLGTNVVLRNGSLLVDRIVIGRGALVGHLTVLGPGVVMGDDSEIAVSCNIGFGVQIGARSSVAAGAGFNHFVRVGPDAAIGYQVYIGAGVRVAPGLRLPSAIVVPSRATLSSQADVARYFSAGSSAHPRDPHVAGRTMVVQEP